jgi:hypothetical protein
MPESIVTERDLLVTEALAWFLSTTAPNRVVLRGERGQIIKILPQVLQAIKKQGKQKKERQKVLAIKKQRRKVLAKSKTTYRRGGRSAWYYGTV